MADKPISTIPKGTKIKITGQVDTIVPAGYLHEGETYTIEDQVDGRTYLRNPKKFFGSRIIIFGKERQYEVCN